AFGRWRRLPIPLPNAPVRRSIARCWTSVAARRSVSREMCWSASSISMSPPSCCRGNHGVVRLRDGGRDLDGEELFGLTAERSLMRRDISVVAAGGDLDVICARDKIVRGIAPAPTVRRGGRLDPRMRCAGDASRAARGGDRVSAHVPGRDPDRAAEPDQKMREILTNATGLAENF